MTQEEKKELLLKDLSARLLYGVICTDNRHGDSRVFNIDIEDESVYYTDFDEYGLIENCKPYLRPMSSMTKVEREEFCKVYEQCIKGVPNNLVDFYNSHHFDYRGLIEKGLALEAPENMYE